MKKQTVEKILMVICIVGIIALAKGFVNKQMRLDEMKKAHVDSLEKVALKVDSLEDIVSFYQIQNPDWELELDANCKDFAKNFEKGFSKDSLVKVVIVGTSSGNGSLKWLIRTKEKEINLEENLITSRFYKLASFFYKIFIVCFFSVDLYYDF